MTQSSKKRLPKASITTLSKAEDAFVRSLLLHEDGEILVFNKPSGLAVQGGSGVSEDLDRLLWAFANRKGRRPKLVHRLDRATSGVMVVAKTSPAAAHLSAQFANRQTQKTYLALCSGIVDGTSGQIQTPLMRYSAHGLDLVRACQLSDSGAMTASTDWRVLSRFAQATLIEAKPMTGRMHQIRAHMADIGHPIGGDDKYGGLFVIGGQAMPRLMLHALALTFTHPGHGEQVCFQAPVAADFQSLLDALERVAPNRVQLREKT